MKKILILLLFLIVSILSFGQLLLKPKAGITFSHLQRPKTIFSWQDNQVPKIGFLVGFALEVPINNRIKFQTELLYTTKGIKDTAHIYSSTPTGTSFPYFKGWGYNFHYLELPVLLRFSFSNRFKLGMGPSISYLLNADKILGEKKVSSPKMNLTKLDYGLNGDLSYTINAFEIGTRYTFGLASVKQLGDPDPEWYNGDVAIGKNRSFQIYFSYSFTK